MKISKHGLFVFPPKKTLIWRRHCSIGQLCCSMTSKRSIGWFLESSRAWTIFVPERSLNQSHATRVCIRSINQSNRPISVRLLFLFCSYVFISRSYENRSILLARILINHLDPLVQLNFRLSSSQKFDCKRVTSLSTAVPSLQKKSDKRKKGYFSDLHWRVRAVVQRMNSNLFFHFPFFFQSCHSFTLGCRLCSRPFVSRFARSWPTQKYGLFCNPRTDMTDWSP